MYPQPGSGHQEHQGQPSGYFASFPTQPPPPLQQPQRQHRGHTLAPIRSMPPTPSTSTARVKQEYDGPSLAGDKANGGKGGASEFVKKLYKMLEDSAHLSIVSWGTKGDSFLVKDMNEFTKTVLPLHFKHSNFASFVRQLNKYDFHKVKATEVGEGIYGDHTWEFKHPNFRADTKHSLEFIKRKGPAPRKSGGPAPISAPPSIAHDLRRNEEAMAQQQGLAALHQQFASLASTQHNMGLHMGSMSRDLHNVYAELVKFQNTFVAQDQLIQNIVQYLVRKESNGSSGTPSPEAQQLLNAYAEISQASAEQLVELTRRANAASGGVGVHNAFSPSPMPTGRPTTGSHSSPASSFEHDGTPSGTSMPMHGPADPYGRPTYRAPTGEPTPLASPHASSPANRVDTTYYASPREPQVSQAQTPSVPTPGYYGAPNEEANANTGYNFPETSRTRSAGSNGGTMLHQQQQQQSAHPPQHQQSAVREDGGGGGGGQQADPTSPTKWKQLPRVLVVEDDVVCRKLSSRFLEVFGCQIDTAVDGVEAVKKMNTQPYDLVFMDIAMPNLDGVSATSIIRQFNSSTPIISMTSNSEPEDILTYFSHGMTDVLPKPFTKDGLRNMLEKHLVHLTQIKQLVEVPRALGFPEDQISQALASTLAPSYLQSEAMFGQEPLNPFAEMGISDEDFTSVLLSTLTPGTGTTPPLLPHGGVPGLPLPQGMVQAGHDGGDPAQVPTGPGSSKRAGPADRDMSKRARYEQ